MKLQRLVEMLRQTRNAPRTGRFCLRASGNTCRVNGKKLEAGSAITAVEVVEGEVLLIRDLDDPPLSVSGLEHELAGLVRAQRLYGREL